MLKDMFKKKMTEELPEELQGEALDDDALDSVAGGAGSDTSENEVDGTVLAQLPNNGFQVQLDDGDVVTAYSSGKMRMYCVKVVVGDRVRVSLSQKGYSHRVTWLYKRE